MSDDAKTIHDLVAAVNTAFSGTGLRCSLLMADPPAKNQSVVFHLRMQFDSKETILPIRTCDDGVTTSAVGGAYFEVKRRLMDLWPSLATAMDRMPQTRAARKKQ